MQRSTARLSIHDPNLYEEQDVPEETKSLLVRIEKLSVFLQELTSLGDCIVALPPARIDREKAKPKSLIEKISISLDDCIAAADALAVQLNAIDLQLGGDTAHPLVRELD